MLEAARAWLWAQVKAIKPAFVSKKPHFNFISVHYFWIIGATIVASIAIFASGGGSLAYIDALMFASGANTQAGLNPVDVNRLNGFQQGMIYLFAMLSNPVTLHACVVFLRLYWFEKRFQTWVREARLRRPTFTFTKSKSRPDVEHAQAALGINGRDITVMPAERPSRITNDGILLGDVPEHPPKADAVAKGDDSDSTTVTDEKPAPPRPPRRNTAADEAARKAAPAPAPGPDAPAPGDGLADDALPQHRSHAEHIAILERQRNEDNGDVLRIPGPRDAERGEGPRRLEAHDPNDDDDVALARLRTAESRAEHGLASPHRLRGRQPTITIAEPEWRRKDDAAPAAAAAAAAADDDARPPAHAAAAAAAALRFRWPRAHSRHRHRHADDEDAHHRPVRTRTIDTIRTVLSRDRQHDDMPYLSYTPTITRNSNFIGLTLEQRQELGGIEYRSLRTLAGILLIYFWGFQLVILAFLLPFILHNNTYGAVVEQAGINRTWWGFFTSNVAFMDVGFTLTPDSMISFQRSEFVLMVMWFFIIIGNTGFPVMLRFLIWLSAKVVPRGSGLWEELRFLLDHPRRCFTLLFPSGPSWWLFWILVALNLLDLLFFLVLDLGAEPIASLPLNNRVVIGFFQAASTRTAGFSAVNMSDLHPAMPVLYMIMMYISVFPIAISIRRTNVYEEKSLGVYHDRAVEDDTDAPALSYVGSHLRRQLSFDLWYVFLGFFIISISEGGQIQAGRFNLFDVLFEVVSAYGTVGLSMGAPGANTSLCGAFSTVGKLVIIAMQIRGRHRGLPYGLDRAVLLPGETRPQGDGGGRRGRSKSRERRNSNLISRFLHPGPVVVRDAAAGARHHTRAASADPRGPFLGPRTHTEPPPNGGTAAATAVGTDLETVPSAESPRHRPQRAETTPALF